MIPTYHGFANICTGVSSSKKKRENQKKMEEARNENTDSYSSRPNLLL